MVLATVLQTRKSFTINQKPFKYLKYNLQQKNNFDKQIKRSKGRKAKHKNFIRLHPPTYFLLQPFCKNKHSSLIGTCNIHKESTLPFSIKMVFGPCRSRTCELWKDMQCLDQCTTTGRICNIIYIAFLFIFLFIYIYILYYHVVICAI